jgi:hypothetical protein
MKQFLLDQFCNFNKEVYINFNSEISKNLPVTGGDAGDIFDQTYTGIWGNIDLNFWFLNSISGKAFENEGIIHCVDFWKNETQYKIITDLYELNKTENFCLMYEPLIFEKHILEVDNHPSGNLRGTEFYYTKFKTPIGGYGFPAGSRFSWHETNINMPRLTYIDTTIKLMVALKKLGHPYCKPAGHLYKDGILFIFDSPFDITNDNLINYVDSSSDSPELKEHLKNLCIQYLI